MTELGGLNHLRGITAPLEQASYDEDVQQWTKRTLGTPFMLPVKQTAACDLTDIECAVQNRKPEKRHLMPNAEAQI